MHDSDILIDESDPATAFVTLNRPAKRNAMSLSMWRGLQAAFETLSAQPARRSIILTGAGGAFCAGADISEFKTVRATPEQGAVYAAAVDAAMDAILHSPKATIAAVSGPAFGGGCSLALACDFRVADAAATFCIPAARLSIVYGVVETKVLLEAVGAAQAKEMLFSACRHGAARAAEIGLATHLAEGAALDEAKALAASLANSAPLSITGAKMTLAALAMEPAGATLAAAETAAAQALASDDYAEGVRAFAEKRPPVFRGA